VITQQESVNVSMDIGVRRVKEQAVPMTVAEMDCV
jgi:hypothetical protein